MCLLIANPQNKPLSKSVLETATDSNPDGFGFAYVKDGAVKIHKAASCDPDRQFALLQKYGWPQLVHWRYTTSGGTCDKFAHPFRLSPTVALAHNGVLPIEIDKGLSDTATLVKSLRKCPSRAVTRLRKLNFKGNKFAVLNTRQLQIVNEDAGTWRDGVWYSNETGFESRYCGNWKFDELSEINRSVDALIQDAEWSLSDQYVEETERQRLEDLVTMLQWWQEGNRP